MGHFIETKVLSSLDKVFPNSNLSSHTETKFSFFKNEVFSFQLAYTTFDKFYDEDPHLKVKINSEISELISVNKVGLVPCEFVAHIHADDDYISKTPGLYPDVLFPLNDENIKIMPYHWQSLWIELGDSNNNIPAGTHIIELCFVNSKQKTLAIQTVTITVLDALLPPQELIHTQWLHCDGICHQYQCEPFSDKFFALLKGYLQTATEHGINMILTPIFTPSLDIEEGGERLTTQLIKVDFDHGAYRFDLSLLDRWIDLATSCGVEYFEMPPFFTQWGSKYSIKIIGNENGVETKLFGWHISASDERYKAFLDAFLPVLIQYFKDKQLIDKVYFHISDEPTMENIENYKNAYNLVKHHLEHCNIIDALSDYEFYQQGLVKIPVSSNDHIEPFIENNVENLWTYYCCAQNKEVSNRFIGLPSYRNRILGIQLYKFSIKGFLHWGYNFWNSQFSKKSIDPYKVTDAGMGFPSGDSFLVYPGENGEPVHSIRLKVMREALNDLRALKCLENLTSHSYVVNLLEKNLSNAISFKEYPRSSAYILNIRQQINDEILKHIR